VYDPNNPVGRLLVNVLAMVAESDLIRLRTKEGMKVAKAKGRLRGKQPKLNRRQEAHLVALLKSGDYSTAELADLFGVARSPASGRRNGSEFGRAWVAAAPLVDSFAVPHGTPCGTATPSSC
jgi:DNA invertase Pin-like site-specific DNA recombinase